MLIHIALGSNLGDARGHLDFAVRRLRAEPGVRVVGISNYYRTTPVGGPPGQADYLNAVVGLETQFAVERVFDLCRRIERSRGRERGVKDAPRTLDLDIVLAESLVIDTPDLVVPHPRMMSRAFVLAPLAEITANVVHPVEKKTIEQLLTSADRSGVSIATDDRAWPQHFAGQRALVTGSTSGIGAAMASAFERHGASVVRHGSKDADLRDAAATDRFLEHVWGDGIDILVCNAGADTLTGGRGKQSFDEKLEQLLAIDVKGTMRVARNIGAKMKDRGRGCILTIGWDQAATGMEGDSGQLFAAAKSAVMGFSKSMAKSLAPEVRVNGIAPGWIRTAWGDTAREVWQERVRSETPLGVWGLPEDIADAAVWLAQSHFISGQIINVNGGVV